MSLVTTALSSAQHHGFHCTGLSQQKIISRSPRQWPHNLRGCSRFHSPQRQKALHVICPKIETHLDHPLIRILLQFSVKYWARKLQEQIKLTHFLQLISLSRWLYLHLQLKQEYISRGYQKSTFFEIGLEYPFGFPLKAIFFLKSIVLLNPYMRSIGQIWSKFCDF